MRYRSCMLAYRAGRNVPRRVTCGIVRALVPLYDHALPSYNRALVPWYEQVTDQSNAEARDVDRSSKNVHVF